MTKKERSYIQVDVGTNGNTLGKAGKARKKQHTVGRMDLLPGSMWP
jgi:hypothetical protein